MVKGTDSNMPTEPSSQPQKINDKKTTKVDKPKPRPIKRGSTILPITILVPTYNKPVIPAAPGPIWIKANNTAGIAAIIEPILGI